MIRYESNNALYHYGVPGMKWGVRKSGYVTGFQARKNATKAARKARKESIAESRASGDTGIGSFQRANRKALNAKRKAYGESMAADRAHNKQLKVEKKAVKKEVDTLYKALNKTNEGARLASVSTYSRLSKVDYDRASELISQGRLRVQAKFKKNYKDKTVDVFVGKDKNPVMRARMENGERYVAKFVKDVDRAGSEAFMTYYRKKYDR